MLIGIYDYDLVSKRHKFFPNVEAMKISAYCKNKKVAVKLIRTLDDISGFDKIYIFKNFPSPLEHKKIWFQDNVICRGKEFQKYYVPLDQEIEDQVPDINLYNDYLQSAYENRKFTFAQISNIILRTNYIRFFNGQTFYDLNKLNRRSFCKIIDHETPPISIETKNQIEKLKRLSSRPAYRPFAWEFKTIEDFKTIYVPNAFSSVDIIKQNVKYKDYTQLIDFIVEQDGKIIPSVPFGLSDVPYTDETLARELIKVLNQVFYANKIGVKANFYSYETPQNKKYWPFIRHTINFLTVKKKSYSLLSYMQTRGSIDSLAILTRLAFLPYLGENIRKLGKFILINHGEGGWVYHG